MARVLIGIPTFNRPDLVQETIASILRQGFTDWRAFVSDNASDGETPEQVRAHVQSLGETKINFYHHTMNGGEYGQGRFFYAQARAGGEEFLLILHDDDLLEPDFLAAGIDALDKHPEAAFFVCNPTIISDDGSASETGIRKFDWRWGRSGVPEGLINVLDTHMRTGFTPISGTLFRMSALQLSGFVDPDLSGCFPFESNVFLRLGEVGMQAWFTPERLFRLRWHNQQMTNWGFLNNEVIVSSTIRLFERRSFSGLNERRRRQLLSRLHRVGALHRARAADAAGTRIAAIAAIRANPKSIKTWAVGFFSIVAPGFVGAIVRTCFRPQTYSTF